LGQGGARRHPCFFKTDRKSAAPHAIVFVIGRGGVVWRCDQAAAGQPDESQGGNSAHVRSAQGWHSASPWQRVGRGCYHQPPSEQGQNVAPKGGRGRSILPRHGR